MTHSRSTENILRDARDTLRTAELGLVDLVSDDPIRRIPGLRNLVVFGRAVTNVLQNLRSTEARFDAWYEPYVVEMRTDPLMRYFYALRSAILKQGEVTTTPSMNVEDFNFRRDRHLWGNPPPNAAAMFIGDRLGGAGWLVKLSDGTEDPYYVKLPKHIMDARLHLPEAPLEHRGRRLTDNTLPTLGAAYFDYHSRLVDAARREFLGGSGGA